MTYKLLQTGIIVVLIIIGISCSRDLKESDNDKKLPVISQYKARDAEAKSLLLGGIGTGILVMKGNGEIIKMILPGHVNY